MQSCSCRTQIIASIETTFTCGVIVPYFNWWILNVFTASVTSLRNTCICACSMSESIHCFSTAVYTSKSKDAVPPLPDNGLPCSSDMFFMSPKNQGLHQKQHPKHEESLKIEDHQLEQHAFQADGFDPRSSLGVTAQQDSQAKQNKGKPKAGKKKRVKITMENLRKLFPLPRGVAAEHLDVSTNCLKRLCRRLGIQRWPYRKIASLDALARSCCQDPTLSQEERQDRLVSIMTERSRIVLEPDSPLDPNMIQARAATYKQRHRAGRGRVGARGRSGRGVCGGHGVASEHGVVGGCGGRGKQGGRGGRSGRGGRGGRGAKAVARESASDMSGSEEEEEPDCETGSDIEIVEEEAGASGSGTPGHTSLACELRAGEHVDAGGGGVMDGGVARADSTTYSTPAASISQLLGGRQEQKMVLDGGASLHCSSTTLDTVAGGLIGPDWTASLAANQPTKFIMEDMPNLGCLPPPFPAEALHAAAVQGAGGGSRRASSHPAPAGGSMGGGLGEWPNGVQPMETNQQQPTPAAAHPQRRRSYAEMSDTPGTVTLVKLTQPQHPHQLLTHQLLTHQQHHQHRVLSLPRSGSTPSIEPTRLTQAHTCDSQLPLLASRQSATSAQLPPRFPARGASDNRVPATAAADAVVSIGGTRESEGGFACAGGNHMDVDPQGWCSGGLAHARTNTSACTLATVGSNGHMPASVPPGAGGRQLPGSLLKVPGSCLMPPVPPPASPTHFLDSLDEVVDADILFLDNIEFLDPGLPPHVAQNAEAGSECMPKPESGADTSWAMGAPTSSSLGPTNGHPQGLAPWAPSALLHRLHMSAPPCVPCGPPPPMIPNPWDTLARPSYSLTQQCPPYTVGGGRLSSCSASVSASHAHQAQASLHAASCPHVPALGAQRSEQAHPSSCTEGPAMSVMQFLHAQATLMQPPPSQGAAWPECALDAGSVACLHSLSDPVSPRLHLQQQQQAGLRMEELPLQDLPPNVVLYMLHQQHCLHRLQHQVQLQQQQLQQQQVPPPQLQQQQPMLQQKLWQQQDGLAGNMLQEAERAVKAAAATSGRVPLADSDSYWYWGQQKAEEVQVKRADADSTLKQQVLQQQQQQQQQHCPPPFSRLASPSSLPASFPPTALPPAPLSTAAPQPAPADPPATPAAQDPDAAAAARPRKGGKGGGRTLTDLGLALLMEKE